MKAEVKTRWTAALRSEKFVQGCGALARIEGDEGNVRYCCLGVLCEVLALPKSVPRDGDEIAFDNCRLTLPMQAMIASGLTADSPSIKVTPRINEIIRKHRGVELSVGASVMLAELNDGYRCSFACIADIIEEAL